MKMYTKKCEGCPTILEGVHYNMRWCLDCKEVRRKQAKNKEKMKRKRKSDEILGVTASDVSHFINEFY